MANKVALVEVFRSVQGEGYNSGRKAIFVRFAGCNLACNFGAGAVCDTPYQHANIKTDVAGLFRDHIRPLLPDEGDPPFPHHDRTMLILTGGEPTLAPAFDTVIDRARKDEFYIAVETNGTHWRRGLTHCDWVTVSPKEAIAQGSPSPHHNPHPGSPQLDPKVVRMMGFELEYRAGAHGEYRYVISRRDDPAPPFLEATRHYLSPAVISDGSGMEWKTGNFPGFMPGAVERCLEIIDEDPRWRLSLQTHKLLGLR